MYINDFLNKANIKHNSIYDYSLINESVFTTHSKVNIICKEHGSFQKRVDHHLRGSGCKKCMYESFSKKYSSNTHDFIEKAIKIHGNKYDYTKVEYKQNDKKIKIICCEHGNFKQTPQHHLSGQGCPKCALYFNRISVNEFMKRICKKHENRYDYSLVKYEGMFKKIKIICCIHGEFLQTPDNHLKGKGCPKCKESYGEKEISNILSKYKIQYIKQYKFKDCRNMLPLSFDFYLPKLNLCIEYDGIQHFKPIDYFGGYKQFKMSKFRDIIKNLYCFKNNIYLLRISYLENIEEKLNNIL